MAFLVILKKRKKNGDKVEMLLTDADSLMYKVEAKNVYEGFSAKIKIHLISVIIKKIQNITMM